MLQRIQTLYLLLVVVLMTISVFLPLAGLESGQEYRELNAFGLVDASNNLQPMWGLFALSLVVIVIALVAVFKYKKRILQIRLCIFNGLIILGFYALLGVRIYFLKQAGEGVAVSLKFALALPLISLVLDYLAIRNIGADEVLVRSLDRLR